MSEAKLTQKPKFEVDTPAGWVYIKKDLGVEFWFEENKDVKIIVTFDQVPTGLDIHKGGLDFFRDWIYTRLPGVEIRHEEEIEINGLPAVEFEFVHEQKGEKVHKLQDFVQHEELLYSITCIAPEEHFYSLKETFNDFTTSFRMPGKIIPK